MDFVLLVVGLALILAGAHYLTGGASELARRFRIPEFVVGATVIGIGTSAPELVVSIGGSLKGSGDIAIGNVVGSNIFNVLMILGITAIILPLQFTDNNVRKDIPFGLLAALVFWVCLSDVVVDGRAEDMVSRSEGLLLLGFFVIFIAYTVFSAIAPGGNKAVDVGPEEPRQSASAKRVGIWLLLLMVLGGLGALVLGGDLFLDKAILISRRFGVSESVIAITLLAGGTSMPELASCLFAAIRKQPQLALGNILGSNIFNIFLVIGTSAAITPLRPAGISKLDMLMVLVSALLLFATAFIYKRRTITRAEGIIFVLIYIGYIAYLISNT